MVGAKLLTVHKMWYTHSNVAILHVVKNAWDYSIELGVVIYAREITKEKLRIFK